MEHTCMWLYISFFTSCTQVAFSTGQVVGLEVSILRVMGSYPTQWTSMYVLVNPNPYGTG
jgi:hypothetical protein